MKILRVVAGLALATLVLAAGLRAALLPPSLPVPPARDWTFRDVTLVEAGSTPRPGRTLRVAQGRIAAIGSEGEAARGAAGDDTSDLAGLEVMPGLVDLHVHYPPRVAVGNAELWSVLLLAHGVTSIREIGSIDGSIFTVRARIEAGEAPGPRIFACGRMLDGPSPSFPSNLVVATPAEARAAVRAQVEAGADCIKAYNRLAPEVLAALVSEARQLGVPVVGHVPHAVAFEDAGLVDLQHGTGAVMIDRELVGRLDFRAEDWQTVDAERIAYVAEISRERGIAHTPTLVNARMRELLTDPDAAAAAWESDTALRHLPRFWEGAWAGLWGPPWRDGDPAGRAAVDHFRARQAALAAGVHAAGAPVRVGTDTLMPYVAPGSSLHGELLDLHAAGIPAEDVLALATRGAGEALGVADLGTLAPGAPADLLFLRPAAPGAPIVERIEAVLVEGRLYRRSDLDAALATLDAHFQGTVYASVMGGVARIARGFFAPDHD